MERTISKSKKSEKMISGEQRLLKAWVAKQGTHEEAAKAIGISRQQLHVIINAGSCKPETLKKIRAVINPATN